MDYLRVGALLLMVFIHTARSFMGWDGLDGVLTTIGEAAPFPFFFALGMTSNRLVASPPAVQVERLGWFGLVAVWHSYHMWFSMHWEFFMCLWVAMCSIALGRGVGASTRHCVIVAALLLVANAVVPLSPTSAATPDAWLQYGPFFPIPWIVPVLLGVGAGIEFPIRWRRTGIVLGLAAAVAAATAKSVFEAPQDPFGLRFIAEKNAATSAYMIAGCAGAALFYLLLGWIPFERSLCRRCNAAVRFVSDRLLVATVLHHLSVRLITDPRWHWSAAVAFKRTAGGAEICVLLGASVVLLLLLL
ncbi:MAG: hypothetical protein HY270_08535, partial [Deltaproteobacteria bacterium]|nr:hypothetical protein [Deltaproteobacteria bacterium]